MLLSFLLNYGKFYVIYDKPLTVPAYYFTPVYIRNCPGEL